MADYSMIAFALLNGGRTAVYFPQMMRVYRDPHGATAVSVSTWTLFAAANAATVSYALTVSDDRIMAVLFSLNAIACLAIAGLTAFKRINFARRGALMGHRIASLRHTQNLVEDKSQYCGPDSSPSTRHRDEMIRQGLMS